MDQPQVLPWVMAVLGAVWFGFVGVRKAAGGLLWSGLGGLYGLVISTAVCGIVQATFPPPSETAHSSPMATSLRRGAVQRPDKLGGLFEADAVPGGAPP